MLKQKHAVHQYLKVVIDKSCNLNWQECPVKGQPLDCLSTVGLILQLTYHFVAHGKSLK